MPYGYLGQNTPNQTVSNSGVFSISDVASLEKQGKFGGSLELIEEKTISASSSAIFTDIKETVYDVHFLQVANFIPSVDNTGLRIRFFESGVEATSGYQYAYQINDGNGNQAPLQSTSGGNILQILNTGNATYESGSSYSYFYNLGNSSKYSFQTQHDIHIYYNGGVIRTMFGGGVLPNASTVNQIKLYVSTGTFSATAKLYGVKQL